MRAEREVVTMGDGYPKPTGVVAPGRFPIPPPLLQINPATLKARGSGCVGSVPEALRFKCN
jgi:hypothetical protein